MEEFFFKTAKGFFGVFALNLQTAKRMLEQGVGFSVSEDEIGDSFVHCL